MSRDLVSKVRFTAACQRRRENAPAGRSKIALHRRMAADAQHSVTPNAAFQFDLMSLLSRPDLATSWLPDAERRGWGGAEHAQHREHGEHRTFPAVSTVAS